MTKLHLEWYFIYRKVGYKPTQAFKLGRISSMFHDRTRFFA